MKKVKITKLHLLSLSSGDLIDLAKQHDLVVPVNFSRQSLINELLELDIDARDLPYKTIQMLGIGEYEALQSSYGKTEIHLLLCDPIWCFAFWDISEIEIEKIVNKSGALHFFLRVMNFKTKEEASPYSFQDIDVSRDERSLYIHVCPDSDFTQVHLMYKQKNASQSEAQVLAKSTFVYFPRQNIQTHLSQTKTEVDEVLNLSGLQYLRLWHYKSFKLLFDDVNKCESCKVKD